MNQTTTASNFDIIQNMTCMDDIYMTVFFENRKECIKSVLDIILPFSSTVESVETQSEYNNVYGRSVRFDILAKDEKNTAYDVEIQRADSGAIPQRARFHSSMLDTKALKAKEDFIKINDTYVIFITENDVLGGNIPVYRIERTITETGVYFNDGEHIIYINAAYKGEGMTDIEKLIHDLTCSNPDEMLIPTLRERCIEIKSGKAQKEVDKMCELLDKRIKEERAEGIAEGRAEGSTQKSNEIAEAMLLSGELSVEKIAQFCQLTVEQVNRIKEKISE